MSCSVLAVNVGWSLAENLKTGNNCGKMHKQ
jgi:hypothetical protein